jgi:hypothetical protein
MTRKRRRSAAPGLQYARRAIRIDNLSRNSKVLSPGAPYWLNLNGWNSHDKVRTGMPAAAGAAAMAFARSLRFTSSENVADLPGPAAACRRRAATREDRIVTSFAVFRGTGSEGDGASKHANRSPGRLSCLRLLSQGATRRQRLAD